MKTNLMKLGMAAAICISLAACSSSDDEVINNNLGKAPVEFNSNLSSAATVTTRADVVRAFLSDTKLALKIVSNKGDYSDVNDGTNGITKTTTATAAGIASAAVDTKSNVTFTAAETAYWDDMFGYGGKLTVTGLAIPGNTTTSTIDNTQKLTVEASQNSTNYAKSDIVYSNNTQYPSGGTDNRLMYDSGNKKFPAGNLIFKHALSKITINIVHGTGFTTNNFVGEPTVTLNGFSYTGTLTLLSGAVITSTDPQYIKDITPEKITKNTGFDYSYQALVIPNSRDFETKGDDHAITITVDNNTYYVKLSEIVPSGTKALESNKNYTVNITINKTGIQTFAQLVDWVDVPVDNVPVIVNSTAIGETKVGNTVGPFDLYRTSDANASTSYDENSTTTGVNPAATVTYTSGAYTCSPLIYWPDHVTPYSYRGMTTGTTVTEDKTGGDYVSVTSVNGTAANGTDLILGAPYTTYPGTFLDPKPATSGNVNMIFTHKKPLIIVRLTTNTTAGATDNVVLAGATVKINGTYTTGKFAMKDFAFTPGTKSNYSMSGGTETTTGSGIYEFNCYSLPQTSLDGVTFTITTAGNNNTYTVNVPGLKDASNTAINSWDDSKQYIYTVKLLKTAITLTAQLTDWEILSVNVGDVKL